MEHEPEPTVVKITCDTHGVLAPAIDNRLAKGIIDKHNRDFGCVSIQTEVTDIGLPMFDFEISTLTPPEDIRKN